jgi:NADH:ubiquinone oxidoreductase subunit H
MWKLTNCSTVETPINHSIPSFSFDQLLQLPGVLIEYVMFSIPCVAIYAFLLLGYLIFTTIMWGGWTSIVDPYLKNDDLSIGVINKWPWSFTQTQFLLLFSFWSHFPARINSNVRIY